ncbi:MAG TPA: hypothetical protein VM577_01455 [Anaerovoracaceae bacterium]|nr:hypothetical protein [Anaerovoracaceae bacterium]
MEENTDLEFEALTESLQNEVVAGDTPYEIELEEEWKRDPDQDMPDYILNGKPGYEPWSDGREPKEIEKEKIFQTAKNNMPKKGKEFVEALGEMTSFELFLDTLPAEERKKVREYAIKTDFLGNPTLEGALMMLYGTVFATRDEKAVQRQFRSGLEEEAGHAIGKISRQFSETLKISEAAFSKMTSEFSNLPEDIRTFVAEVKDSKESFNKNAEKQATIFDQRMKQSYDAIVNVAEKEFRNKLVTALQKDIDAMDKRVDDAISKLIKKWDSIEAKSKFSTFLVSALGSFTGMGLLLVGLRALNII